MRFSIWRKDPTNSPGRYGRDDVGRGNTDQSVREAAKRGADLDLDGVALVAQQDRAPASFQAMQVRILPSAPDSGGCGTPRLEQHRQRCDARLNTQFYMISYDRFRNGAGAKVGVLMRKVDRLISAI